MRLRRDAKVRLLEEVPLFHGCTDAELARVAKLARDVVSYSDGSTLIYEGALGDEFLLLVEGRAKVQIQGHEVSILRPGDYFGEIALLNQSARTATVVAEGPMRALVFDEGAFAAMLDEVPAVRPRVTRTALDRLAHKPADH